MRSRAASTRSGTVSHEELLAVLRPRAPRQLQARPQSAPFSARAAKSSETAGNVGGGATSARSADAINRDGVCSRRSVVSQNFTFRNDRYATVTNTHAVIRPAVRKREVDVWCVWHMSVTARVFTARPPRRLVLLLDPLEAHAQRGHRAVKGVGRGEQRALAPADCLADDAVPDLAQPVALGLDIGGREDLRQPRHLVPPHHHRKLDQSSSSGSNACATGGCSPSCWVRTGMQPRTRTW